VVSVRKHVEDAVADEKGKLAKSDPTVNYTVNGTDKKHCGNCSMYRGGLCTAVKGYIAFRGYCDLWKRAE
jgi:hypothetical protein